MLIVQWWVAELSHLRDFKINFIIILKTIIWTGTKNLIKKGWKNVGPTHNSLWTLVTHCLHAVGGKMYFFCSCFTSLRSNNFEASKKSSESDWGDIVTFYNKARKLKKLELDIIWNPHLNLKKLHKNVCFQQLKLHYLYEGRDVSL